RHVLGGKRRDRQGAGFYLAFKLLHFLVVGLAAYLHPEGVGGFAEHAWHKRRVEIPIYRCGTLVLLHNVGTPGFGVADADTAVGCRAFVSDQRVFLFFNKFVIFFGGFLLHGQVYGPGRDFVGVKFVILAALISPQAKAGRPEK